MVAGSLSRNAIFLAIERFVSGVIAIITIPLAIRWLGLEAYGFWSIAAAVFGYMACIDFGITFSFDYFVSSDLSKKDFVHASLFLSTALSFLLILFLFLTIFCIAAGESLTRVIMRSDITISGISNVFLWMIPFVGLQLFSATLGSVLRGIQRFDVVCSFQIITKVVYFLVFFVLAEQLKSVWALYWALLVQSALGIIFCLVANTLIVPQVHIKLFVIDKRCLQDMASYGLKIFVSFLATVFSLHFDKLLLASTTNLAIVGVYEAISKVLFALRDIPLFISSIVTPRTAQLFSHEDRVGIEKLTSDGTLLLSTVSAVLFSSVCLFRPDLLEVLHIPVKDQPLAKVIFSILSFACMWHVSSAVVTNALRGIRVPQYEMYANLCGLAINTAGSFFLIRHFGVMGAAWGTAMALFVSPIATFYFGTVVLNQRPIGYVRQFLQMAGLWGIACLTVSTLPATVLKSTLMMNGAKFGVLALLAGLSFFFVRGVLWFRIVEFRKTLFSKGNDS